MPSHSAPVTDSYYQVPSWVSGQCTVAKHISPTPWAIQAVVSCSCAPTDSLEGVVIPAAALMHALPQWGGPLAAKALLVAHSVRAAENAQLQRFAGRAKEPQRPAAGCVQQSAGVVGREASEALTAASWPAWPHQGGTAWTNLDLHPGDSLRITVARDRSSEKGDLGLANAIPVASPGVRWNCGGWIDARVAQVDLGSRRATLLVEMGELDSGHAGPSAFHTTKDVVRNTTVARTLRCPGRDARAPHSGRPLASRGTTGADTTSVSRR